jgi:hypothetical protein
MTAVEHQAAAARVQERLNSSTAPPPWLEPQDANGARVAVLCKRTSHTTRRADLRGASEAVLARCAGVHSVLAAEVTQVYVRRNACFR